MTTYNPAADPEVRRTMIGASDGAAVLGLRSYGRTALTVCLEKRGELEPPNLDEVEVIQFGQLLEDDVAAMYTIKTGTRLVRPPDTYRHPVHNFIGCHPDYLSSSMDILVECKTVNITHPATMERRMEWGDPGTDQIPQNIIVQCHHQMLVTGRSIVDVPALIGGRGLVIYRVERDDEFLGWYEAELVRFWNDCVLGGKFPEPVNLADCKVLYPHDDGRGVVADAVQVEAWRALTACREATADLKANEEPLITSLQKFMGEASVLFCDGQVAATWKADKNGRRRFVLKKTAEV